LVLDATAVKPREVLLPATASSDGRPLRGLLEVQSSIALLDDGTLHACIGNADVATRYRVKTDDPKPERVGSECGQLALGADGTTYLAIRGKPQVAILSRDTGKIQRTLALPGIAVFAAA
jgi:hypothetical protein